jgi:hypothetical protein
MRRTHGASSFLVDDIVVVPIVDRPDQFRLVILIEDRISLAIKDLLRVILKADPSLMSWLSDPLIPDMDAVVLVGFDVDRGMAGAVLAAAIFAIVVECGDGGARAKGAPFDRQSTFPLGVVGCAAGQPDESHTLAVADDLALFCLRIDGD